MAIIRATGTITNGDLTFFKSATVNSQNVLADITLESSTRWQLEFDDTGFPEEYELVITGETLSGNEVTRSRTYEKATVKVVGSTSNNEITDGLNPAPGATLTGSSQQFTISGIGSSLWGITVSTDPNDFVGSAAFFNSGPLVHALNTITLTNAPTNGQTIYVRSAIGDGVNPATQVIHEYTAHSASAGTAPSPGPVSGIGPYPRLVPNAEGYGITAEVAISLADIRVANNFGEFLSNLGPNRVVIPNFSGWHEATSQIDFGRHNLWIPGQFAPGQGFGIHVGNGSHNLSNTGGSNRTVLSHFRLAPGSDGADGNVDPVRVEGGPASKLLLDHMHLYWGRDQICSIWFGSTDVVFSECILGPTTDSNDCRGPLVGSNSQRVMMLRTLIAGCRERNPHFQGVLASLVNCGVIGWAREPITFADNGSSKGRGNVIKCVVKNGPNSDPNNRGEIMFFERSGAGMEVYAEGNITTRQPDPDGDQSVNFSSALTGVAFYPNLAAYTPSNLTIASSRVGPALNVNEMNAVDVEAYLYANAGPVPNRRDSKIQDIITRCGNGSMTSDSSGSVSSLPTLSGGPSRIDNSRADKIGAALRNQIGMPDSADGRTDVNPATGWPWFFEAAHAAASLSS